MNNEIDNCCGTTADKKKMAQEIADLKQQVENLMLSNASTSSSLTKLQKLHNDRIDENNGLKAQAEHLKLIALKYRRRGVHVELLSDLNKTPRQCLASVKADAVGDAMQKFKYEHEGPRDTDSIESFFYEIEKQLREGEL